MITQGTCDKEQHIHTYIHTRDLEVGLKQQHISLTFNSKSTFSTFFYHMRGMNVFVPCVVKN